MTYNKTNPFYLQTQSAFKFISYLLNSVILIYGSLQFSWMNQQSSLRVLIDYSWLGWHELMGAGTIIAGGDVPPTFQNHSFRAPHFFHSGQQPRCRALRPPTIQIHLAPLYDLDMYLLWKYMWCLWCLNVFWHLKYLYFTCTRINEYYTWLIHSFGVWTVTLRTQMLLWLVRSKQACCVVCNTNQLIYNNQSPEFLSVFLFCSKENPSFAHHCSFLTPAVRFTKQQIAGTCHGWGG